MSTDSKIEWTDATWNPVTGCTRVSAGCDHCYAVRQSFRNGEMGHAKYRGLTVLNRAGERHFNGVVRTHDDALEIPLRWRRPRRVFVNSMSDLFHRAVPFDFIDRVFAVMALCPQHTFQVLTKRPERMAEYFATQTLNKTRREDVQGEAYTLSCGFDEPWKWDRPIDSMPWPLLNVWLGTSVENQAAADRRVTELVKCPAAARFLSCEPLLGPLNLKRALNIERSDVCGWMPAINGQGPNVDWVIVGGESGPGSRECNVDWIRRTVRQCRDADVPVFVKQVGAHVVDHGTTSAEHFEPEQCWPKGTRTDVHRVLLKDKKGGTPTEWPADLRVREMPGTTQAAGAVR